MSNTHTIVTYRRVWIDGKSVVSDHHTKFSSFAGAIERWHNLARRAAAEDDLIRFDRFEGEVRVARWDREPFPTVRKYRPPMEPRELMPEDQA